MLRGALWNLGAGLPMAASPAPLLLLLCSLTSGDLPVDLQADVAPVRDEDERCSATPQTGGSWPHGQMRMCRLPRPSDAPVQVP